MDLYHGSDVKIERGYLKPKKPFQTANDETGVYLSNFYEYALLFCCNPIKMFNKKNNISGKVGAFSAHIRKNANNDTIEIYEICKDFFDDVYENEGYIYVCESNKNVKNKNNGIFMSNKPIKIKGKEHIKSVKNKILELSKTGKIVVVRYNDIDHKTRIYLQDAIESRKYYSTENEKEFFEFYKL